jgi:hypothetical protein
MASKVNDSGRCKSESRQGVTGMIQPRWGCVTYRHVTQGNALVEGVALGFGISPFQG